MSNFNVYVIHSAKPLDELKTILVECGGYSYAGIIYKSVTPKDGSKNVGSRGTRKEETKKTIVFCPENTILSLKKNHPEYEAHVANYNWDSFPMPNIELGESKDLHISGVPNDYTVKEAEDFVKSSLACVLPESSYKVSFAPRLRETGEINGYGHIIFNENVPERSVRYCKLVLHNTPVGFKKNPSDKRMVTCVWHRHAGTVEKKKPVRIPKNGFEGAQRHRPAVQVDVSNITSKGELVMMSKTGPVEGWPVAVKTVDAVSSVI